MFERRFPARLALVVFCFGSRPAGGDISAAGAVRHGGCASTHGRPGTYRAAPYWVSQRVGKERP